MPANEVIKFTITANDRASAAFNKTFKSLSVGTQIVSKTAKAMLGAGTAIVGFTALIANGIDKQAKFATRLGESISILTKYQFLANQSGISTDSFNMAVQRMERRVAEAAKGLGEARGVLAEMNIDAREFTTLPLDDKLAILADKTAGYTNEKDRLRVAMKLFDSEGVAMLQMLDQGSEALRAAGEDAEYLGVAISAHAGKQAELFSDKMGRAKSSLQGLANAVGGELMPLLTGLADKFANFIADNRVHVANFVKGSIEGFMTFGMVVEQVFERVGQILTNVSPFNSFLTAMGELIVQTGLRGLEVGKAIAQGLAEGLKIAGYVLKEFGDYAADRIRAIFTKEKVMPIGEAFTTILSEGFNRATENIKDTWSNVSGVLIENAKNTGAEIGDSLGINLDAASEKARAAIENISLFAQTAGDKIPQHVEKVSEFMKAIKEQQEAFMSYLNGSYTSFAENLNVTMQGAIDNLSNGLANAIMTGASLMDVFKNVAKQTLTAVLGALIKLGVQRLILAATNKAATTSEAAAQVAAGVGLAGVNMFASWAGAPWPISMGAPAAAAAAITGASAAFTTGAATGAALGSSVGAVAHGGLTNNPDEQTVLVRRGERIISPRQNQDLTAFLEGGGGAGFSVGSLNITMFPNATNADAVFEMPTNEIASKMEDAVITALNNASRKGIKPDFAERRT